MSDIKDGTRSDKEKQRKITLYQFRRAVSCFDYTFALQCLEKHPIWVNHRINDFEGIEHSIICYILASSWRNGQSRESNHSLKDVTFIFQVLKFCETKKLSTQHLFRVNEQEDNQCFWDYTFRQDRSKRCRGQLWKMLASFPSHLDSMITFAEKHNTLGDLLYILGKKNPDQFIQRLSPTNKCVLSNYIDDTAVRFIFAQSSPRFIELEKEELQNEESGQNLNEQELQSLQTEEEPSLLLQSLKNEQELQSLQTEEEPSLLLQSLKEKELQSLQTKEEPKSKSRELFPGYISFNFIAFKVMEFLNPNFSQLIQEYQTRLPVVSSRIRCLQLSRDVTTRLLILNKQADMIIHLNRKLESVSFSRNFHSNDMGDLKCIESHLLDMQSRITQVDTHIHLEMKKRHQEDELPHGNTKRFKKYTIPRL